MLDIRDRKEYLRILRLKEIQEHTNKIYQGDYYEKLKYSQDIKMNTRIARHIRDNFDVHEWTTHFYDAETKFDAEKNIKIPRSWEDKMSFNNYIDVECEGIDNISQDIVNKRAFECMLDVIRKKDGINPIHYSNVHRWHIFIYESTIILYWFGRDVDCYMGHDYYWIYTPKNKEEPIDILYFLVNCYGVDE